MQNFKWISESSWAGGNGKEEWIWHPHFPYFADSKTYEVM